jgi:Ca-activated chloride channel family protein
MKRVALALALLPAAASAALAQGLVIPNEPELPPLALQKHHVRVEIESQGATTWVEQTFVNHTQRRLEAQYLFPIPRGAAMSRFAMLVDGREIKADVVDKSKARSLYQSMIDRAKDPGLLEYLGSDVFRANLLLEPGESRTLTLRYEELLTAQNSLASYVYRVRQGARRGPTVHGDVSIRVSIRSAAPLGAVYSPSHPVLVERASEREATASFADKGASLDRDFQLYFGASDQGVGAYVVTHRPDPSRPGTFMLLLSPRSELQSKRIVERDVVFVVDTSGSMAGEKMRQARQALKYCLQNLNPGDRFNLVRFSTEAQRWKPGLVPADEMLDAGIAWVEALTARGGTAIDEALEMALAMPRDPARPFFVIFMTDGQPTIGEADPNKILRRATALDASTRIFTWGVGYDVDTNLLDELAAAGRGVSEYVHPEEDIAVKVAAFYGKTRHPVLTNLELAAVGEGVQLLDLHPRTPGDLYAGGQIAIFGRYTGSGELTLRLSGRVNDQVERFEHKVTFAPSETRHAFVETLWARREIGHLLAAIRAHGEKRELVDDVIRLAVEHGIQTPYTSYLVMEDGTRAAVGMRDGRAWSGGAKAEDKGLQARLDSLAKPAAPAPPPSQGQRGAGGGSGEREEQNRQNEVAKNLEEGFAKKDGKAAVESAAYLRRLREAERSAERGQVAACRRAGGVRFFEYRGMWVDERFEERHAETLVRFGSAASFRILERRPELVEQLKIAQAVVVVTGRDRALVVGASGAEELSDAEIDKLF